METIVYGLQACSICHRTETVAAAALAIATQMRADDATDAEIRDAIEAKGLSICGHCPADDDIEAEVVGEVVTVNLAPRGPLPAYYHQ